MYLSEGLQTKWAGVLDHPDLAPIQDPYKKAVTAVILENQAQEMTKSGQMLNEAVPTNSASAGLGSGGAAGFSGSAASPVAGFDPILISLVRRSLPNLIAYDVAGVQPMTGPTGLIFAMRSLYTSQSGAEAFYNEANTGHAGLGSAQTTLAVGSAVANTFVANGAGVAGMSTALAEALGDGSNTFQEMAFSIEKVTVTAKTRALKAEYSIELAQDLKAVHGLDAETELANILSSEILAEINREVVRTVYATANVGIVSEATAVFNLSSSADTSGRWQVEKYKSLLFAIERAANKIAKDTRRGKGNMLIVSTDVASALAMTGLLDYNSALSNNTNLAVDDTGNSFAGTLFGRIKVYVDPYSVSGTDYVVVGYKGTTPYDAGLFYCPYVPLQMVRAIDPTSYQPKVGFKTRYGLVANPFATGAGTGALANNSNFYYRRFEVLNINQ